MTVSVTERDLQLQALGAALTMRTALDTQKRQQAGQDLKDAITALPSETLFILQRALDMTQLAVAAELWDRNRTEEQP